MNLTPNSWGVDLREYNRCHDDQGKFCDDPGDSQSVTDIKNYLKLVVQMRSTRALPPGWVYAGAEDYILQHGKGYESQPLTAEEAQIVKDASKGLTFPIKECWRNAARMVNSDASGELRFAEGWVDIGLGIPIRHAWVTIHGKVVDPTIRPHGLPPGTRVRGTLPPGFGYFGVEFTSKEVTRAVVRTKVYDSIVQPEMKDSPHMYVKRGQPLPTLAKECV